VPDFWSLGIRFDSMKKLLHFVLPLLAFALSGCALSHHRPEIEFPDSGRAILHFKDSPLVARGLPYIEASIHGEEGTFIIDTGANAPYLTMNAVRRCRLSFSDTETKKADIYHGKGVPMKVTRDVKIVIAKRLSIHWSKAVVDPREDAYFGSYFGLLDYHTLKAMHAVIDMDAKTITISR
jgi:hypothetical protein